MKKYLLFATALMALASCSSDEFVGDNTSPEKEKSDAISFGFNVPSYTRADHEGSDAASLLGNNFVVYGVKGDGNPVTSDAVVFDQYNVNWVNNTANTTTSNTDNWEYVGQTKHAHTTAAEQSIKYWDYSADQYNFIAYSKGTATAVYADGDYNAASNILISAISKANLTTAAYTVKGKADNLAKFYIADMVTKENSSDYNNKVELTFRSLSAKVRIGLYETVPGYSVKNVVFYTADATAADDGKAHLYTKGGDVFNAEGTYTVYYPTIGTTNKSKTDFNKAHVSFAPKAEGGTVTVKDFGALDLTNTGANKHVAEAEENVYLGRASNAATYAGDNSENHYTTVIPNETGAVLNLKVNYTLLSTDGSGEVINVTGATAQVPAVYASWKSGYAYTYLFKISQNTNGVTNPSLGPAGLYPITFDAVVVETEDGVQETITTVADPSITTYAKGVVVTANDEYTTSSNIYAMVNGATLTAENTKLYTVTLADGAAQTINEASVANALAHGTESPTGTWTVTDANGKAMAVTSNAGLSIVTEIAATDSPNGNAITVNAAKFTPASAGTYVIEYLYGKKYTPVADTDVSDGTWFTDVYCTVAATGTANGTTDYYRRENKTYKIVKVVAAP